MKRIEIEVIENNSTKSEFLRYPFMLTLEGINTHYLPLLPQTKHPQNIKIYSYTYSYIPVHDTGLA